MPTLFKHEVVTDVGKTPVDVLQIQPGVRATVIGVNLANKTEFDTININLYVIDENSTVATYAKAIPIPPNTSLKMITQGEKLILPANSGIRIESDTDDSVDAVISYVEIS